MPTNDSIIPRHVGFIVDGNRRWAKKHGLPPYEGHLAGYNSLKDIVIAMADAGVEYTSFYTFSTENWKRAKDEVNNLMSLMMRLFKTDLKLLLDNDLRLLVLGTRDKLPAKMNAAIDSAQEQTAHCRKATVVVCFNYGGQQEVVDAVRQLVDEGATGEAITIDAISDHLYHPEVPPVDLIVRTSGEQRLSNFMLWRSPYSELMFMDMFWPDMTKDDVTRIMEEYSSRQRRFGG
ncbi:MAG: uppS [Candidatus Saccharibacteria bacterium]|nr:uppS [Candidatus Saccharibacteria bacterium]